MTIYRPGRRIITIGNPGLSVISPRGGAAWTPASITGLKFWLDFSDLTTLFTDAGSTNVSANDDLIYQANDKAAGGLHVTQTDSDIRPKYKTNIKNGLSIASFDGSNDKLTRSNVALSSLVDTDKATMFFVMYFDADADDRYNTVLLNANTNENRINYHPIYDGTQYYDHGNIVSGGRLTAAAAVTMGQWALLDTVRNGSSGKTYKNGTVGIDGTFTDSLDTTASGRLTIGDLGKSYIGEIIIYNVGLSDTDRQTVEAYLNAKWSIY